MFPAHLIEQCADGDPGRIAVHIARQTTFVTDDVEKLDPRFLSGNGYDFVPGVLDGKAKRIESATDI